MIAVIMAGGKGTRIASINSEIPKPMIPISGKPILEYEIEVLKNQKIIDIYLVVGHLSEKIVEYFGDGTKFGVKIKYIYENVPLGTAGALYYLKNEIYEDFLLLNGDTIFDVDLHKFYDSHKKNNCLATIITHPNSHPYDSGVIFASNDGKVTKWLTKEDDRTWYKNRVNAGIHILSNKLLNRFNDVSKKDLDRDILKQLIKEGELYIYDSPEYIKDMGTPERYYEVIRDIETNKVWKRNLVNKQKAIFLDRDGTINKYKGFLTNIDDFELIDGAVEAIKMINNSDYLAIVITNQPVIARGEVTITELQMIHNKMETLLGYEGAYLDAIYYCPHHPHKGYKGEVVEFKIDCNCRKPKIGLIEEAAKRFNINLEQSWFVGDSEIDILCGKNAKCKTAYICNNKQNLETDLQCNNLLEAIKKIIKY